jgi:GR25 family glycosyltransferase involved in LPS biosynthesis
MKYAYKVLHIEGVSQERDAAVNGIKQIMAGIEELPCLTIDFVTPEYRHRFLDQNPDFKTTKPFKIGELGVWASNIEAWKAFLDSDYDALLLFEDDVNLDPDFVKGMEAYLNKLPHEWDLFSPYIHWWQEGNLYKEEYSVNDEICIAYQNWSLAAYFISKEGARKALASISGGIYTAIDLHLFKGIYDFNAYTTQPKAKKYTDLYYFESTIQNNPKLMSVSAGGLN